MSIPLLKNRKDLFGKRVLLRLDLNVALLNGHVLADFRIRKIFPTLDFLIAQGAKILILSHLDEKEGNTLEPVAKYLVEFYPVLRFIPDLFGNDAEREIKNLKNGGIILFENIRKWKGEKDNDGVFASRLAALGDIYVNDAFSASHREHASIVGLPKLLPSCIGFLFEEEIKNLSRAFDPSHPFVFILGGAKFETKIPLINKFLPLCDNMFIGGAIANTFWKNQGYFLGDSLVGEEHFETEDFAKNPKIILPIDVRTQHKGFKYIKKPTEISVGEKIWDIGEKSAKNLSKIIKDASFVIWNGPMGNIEAGEVQGTVDVAKAVASSDAKSIVGGGDTIEVLEKNDLLEKFSFVSTGGGAMLEFLTEETLPGITAILGSARKNKIAEESKSWWRRLFS